VSCKVAGQRPATFAINGTFLRQYLAGKAGNVVLEGCGPLNPFVWRQVTDEAPDGAAAYVQMPMATTEELNKPKKTNQELAAELRASRDAARQDAAQEGPPSPEAVAEHEADSEADDAQGQPVAGDDEDTPEEVERERPVKYAVVCGEGRAWVHFGPNLPVDAVDLAEDTKATFLSPDECRSVAREEPGKLLQLG
jgi:hypothetical protein